MYTFVDNKDLNSEFLQLILKHFSDCVKINESAYSIKRIDYQNVATEVKAIYDEAEKNYPSKGKDFVGILYAAKLANVKDKDKSDRIIEQIIIGETTKSAIVGL